jgi:metal-sulfur cluster biosynthetic enzyme
VSAAAGAPSSPDGTYRDAIVAANPQLADDPLLAEVWRRVQSVEDPCHELAGYPLTIADLGIVNRVELDGGYVEIGITYTELGCSFAPRILQRLEQELSAVPGVTSMDVVYEPFPPWTPDRMSPRAQELYRQRSLQARTAVASIPLESIRRPRHSPGEA